MHRRPSLCVLRLLLEVSLATAGKVITATLCLCLPPGMHNSSTAMDTQDTPCR